MKVIKISSKFSLFQARVTPYIWGYYMCEINLYCQDCSHCTSCKYFNIVNNEIFTEKNTLCVENI